MTSVQTGCADENVLSTGSVLLLCAVLHASQRPREQWGGVAVAVTESPAEWTLAGTTRTVNISKSGFGVRIRGGPASWETLPSSPGDVIVRRAGVDIPLRLSEAHVKGRLSCGSTGRLFPGSRFGQ